jgi:hypothetical protein
MLVEAKYTDAVELKLSDIGKKELELFIKVGIKVVVADELGLSFEL